MSISLALSLVPGIARSESGIASVYDYPQPVACGGRYDRDALTAAHRTLPCGARVRVTNQRNGKSAIVTVNDRGPFVRGRIIDLSAAAARAIRMSWGLAPVELEIVQ